MVALLSIHLGPAERISYITILSFTLFDSITLGGRTSGQKNRPNPTFLHKSDTERKFISEDVCEQDQTSFFLCSNLWRNVAVVKIVVHSSTYVYGCTEGRQGGLLAPPPEKILPYPGKKSAGAHAYVYPEIGPRSELGI